MMSGSVLLFVAALAYALPQASDTSRCDYTVRDICGAGKPCSKFQSQREYLLVPSLATLEKAFPSAVSNSRPAAVQKCDQRGCTAIEVWAARSGAFINVWQTDGGYMLKLFEGPTSALPGFNVGDFVEVATFGLGAWVGSGHCVGWGAR
jgi:hypothetical protein